MKVHLLSITLLFTMLVAGCGSDETNSPSAETMADEGASSPEDSPALQTPKESTSAPLTVEDIDRWQRGMEAELQAVQEAEESLSRAATSEDTLSAMMAANDMSTRAAGAQAAGVSEDRYQFIRTTFSSAVRYLSPLEDEMDVSQMSASMIEQFEKDRQASLDQMSNVLPADVLEALRTRAAELRQQDRSLTGARLTAVGMSG